MTIFTFYCKKIPFSFGPQIPILIKQEIAIPVDEFSSLDERASAQEQFDSIKKHVELKYGEILCVTQNYVGEYSTTNHLEYIFDGDMKHL